MYNYCMHACIAIQLTMYYKLLVILYIYMHVIGIHLWIIIPYIGLVYLQTASVKALKVGSILLITFIIDQ